MKRVMFTGGSGKAGRHVVQHLVEHGHQVLNLDTKPLDNPQVRTLLTDITDSGQVFDALSSYMGLGEFDRSLPPIPASALIKPESPAAEPESPAVDARASTGVTCGSASERSPPGPSDGLATEIRGRGEQSPRQSIRVSDGSTPHGLQAAGRDRERPGHLR